MALNEALTRVYAIQHGLSVDGHSVREVHEASLDLNAKVVPVCWINGEVIGEPTAYYGGNIESEFALRMICAVGNWRSDNVALARKFLEPIRDAFLEDEMLFAECERGIDLSWGRPAVGQISQWGGSFVVVDALLTMRFLTEHVI